MSEKKKTPPDTSDEKYPDIKPYPAKDDIYSRSEELENVDPEEITKTKTPNADSYAMNELVFREDMTAEDLDVPGNDEDESAKGDGGEDEENNYYSLGGDKKK